MPDTSWARHSNTEWNKTLSAARDAGWSFQKFSSHAFGKISCPAGTHSKIIFSTGSGSENVARDTYRLITEKCEHRPDLPRTIGLLNARLDNAERLVTAAESLLDKGDVETKIQELLGEADSEVDEVATEALNERFDELVNEADAIERSLDAAVAQSEPAGLLAEASSEARDAKNTLRSIPKRHEHRDALIERLEAIQARITECRSRLEA